MDRDLCIEILNRSEVAESSGDIQPTQTEISQNAETGSEVYSAQRCTAHGTSDATESQNATHFSLSAARHDSEDSEVSKMICPHCNNDKFDHDEWEDIYRCVACNCFWYPEELGLKTNANAGVFRLGEA